ncbi:protein of unknown function [Candidatus Nitrosotalea okcheonensis]|uniref:Uncharacterized protein n=1 Tax=Candidatus Nitrosotalea okcheonensis TaxID=1903276 RepID=A0A2H1FEF5_9ARCH|nr:protein of unknown function [Candidatus Nitrosotalea okcheonensis]
MMKSILLRMEYWKENLNLGHYYCSFLISKVIEVIGNNVWLAEITSIKLIW